jgi:hypothetical protein
MASINPDSYNCWFTHNQIFSIMKTIKFLLLIAAVFVFANACKKETKQELATPEASTIVSPDGISGDIANQGGVHEENQSQTVVSRSVDCTTINFENLADEEVVTTQYSSQGVSVVTGPNGPAGIIIGDDDLTCGSIGIRSVPTPATELFNFSGTIASVSVDAGDNGDLEVMTLTAYTGLNATGAVVASTTLTKTVCGFQTLLVAGASIRSAELTSTSAFPNSLIVENLSFCLADTDGDGFNDDEDAHPNSNLDATVNIDGCDSGVSNVQVGGGSTMMDLILDCAANANDHSEFVSCVSALTNAWKAAGLITGAQKGAIQSCAGQANIP